jgi:hypothetical protein
MSVQDDIKASLDTLFTTVVKDELAVTRPLADSYLTSIVTNPAPDNVVAQSIAFQTQAIAALPNIEAAAAKDTAASLKALIDLEADKLTGATPGTTATVAAAAA